MAMDTKLNELTKKTVKQQTVDTKAAERALQVIEATKKAAKTRSK
jgi:hypothetical protein